MHRIALPAFSILLWVSVQPGTTVSHPAIQPGIDEAFVVETVESVAEIVNRVYFDSKVASRVADGLLDGLQIGRYSDVPTHEQLAEMLTKHLLEMTEDKHLGVISISPTDESRVSDEARKRSREVSARRRNYGVRRIEILPGNVGYLDISFFYRPSEAQGAVEAAMESLRHSDALIIDMRSNKGGSPGTVGLLLSYLFEAPGKLLFDIIPREGETTSYRTESPAPPHSDGVKPVYVLTAANTFSAGEGFAFLLQEQGRAEIVGEVTAGAANPGRGYPVNSRFEALVPNSKVRSAVKAGNWEGTGVVPDVPVRAGDALLTAYGRALDKLLESTEDTRWEETLRQELQRIQSR